MSTDHNTTDHNALRRQDFAAQITPVLIEKEGLDPAHAATIVHRLVSLASFDDAGMMTVEALDGSPSTIKAELERAKVDLPFAFADKEMAPVKHDLTTAAGRRAAESAANYTKATSDGNPFKKRYWNLTHQTMIAKKDPDLARRMKEAAKGQ